MECPTAEAGILSSPAWLTKDTLSKNWLFCIVYELAQLLFARPDICARLDDKDVLAVELDGIPLSVTNRCCVLLVPPAAPNCAFTLQDWPMSVRFVNVRLLTYAKSSELLKTGACAPQTLA
jgi:hypothetical protein